MTLTTTSPETMPALREADAKDLERTTPLKLSEALRLGAMSTTQVFSKLGSTDDATACGIGAVFVGLGYQFSGGGYQNLIGANPELAVLYTPINLTGRMPGECLHGAMGDIVSTIVHLNDDHEMPRERIADWLQGLGL